MTEIRAVAPTDPDDRLLLREYLGEVIGRYYGRPATEAEIDEELAERPYHLAVTLIAYVDGEPAGCAGLREADGYLELKRLYVRPAQRGTGLARLLVAETERHAAERGASVIRLETRTDLVEARRLYARLGYTEIPGYGDDPYTDHSFEKRIARAATW
ncbi:GNAT family N-acetyltransferase [Sciscionella sediminilitoris]|uniref:GNAT family N-acetyltransferase n=1 Tax=Sciscionella sediminilitoris TaxID=1445613 RepID=UPI0004DEFB90|nr:GNAT family N-acetyltransferase [Sciscionella sp. SE31]